MGRVVLPQREPLFVRKTISIVFVGLILSLGLVLTSCEETSDIKPSNIDPVWSFSGRVISVFDGELVEQATVTGAYQGEIAPEPFEGVVKDGEFQLDVPADRVLFISIEAEGFRVYEKDYSEGETKDSYLELPASVLVEMQPFWVIEGEVVLATSGKPVSSAQVVVSFSDEPSEFRPVDEVENGDYRAEIENPLLSSIKIIQGGFRSHTATFSNVEEIAFPLRLDFTLLDLPLCLDIQPQHAPRGNIDISVSEGLSPTFSWSPTCFASKLTVRDITLTWPDNVVFQIVTEEFGQLGEIGEFERLIPPIVYGDAPPGTKILHQGKPLVAGAIYDVTLSGDPKSHISGATLTRTFAETRFTAAKASRSNDH